MLKKYGDRWLFSALTHLLVACSKQEYHRCVKRFLFGLCLFFLIAASWEAGAWDKIDYQRLMATKKCVKCDLTEAYLSGADLVFTNLSGANLSGANLTETKKCVKRKCLTER